MAFQESIDSLKKILINEKNITDNFIYGLHYKTTMLILIGCCGLVTFNEIVGEPIHCLSNEKQFGEESQKFINSFCWIRTTFSIESEFDGESGQEIVYPGIGRATGKDSTRIYHAYYQWVSLTLFLQAITFSLPNFLWRYFENGLIKKLKQNLDQVFLEKKVCLNQVKNVVEYLCLDRRKPIADRLFFIFFFTEALNLINVVLQMYWMNFFLGGAFFDHGFQLLALFQFDWFIRFDLMVRIFPRLTKCNFHYFGPSGSIQLYDTLCMLPINNINEKIYIFLWLWFSFLTALTLVALFYRLLTITFQCFRAYVLRLRYGGMVDAQTVQHIGQSFNPGNWFILYVLCKNVDPIHSKLIFEQLSQRIKRNTHTQFN